MIISEFKKLLDGFDPTLPLGVAMGSSGRWVVEGIDEVIKVSDENNDPLATPLPNPEKENHGVLIVCNNTDGGEMDSLTGRTYMGWIL